jgi:phosphonate transport system substrate-binding protein
MRSKLIVAALLAAGLTGATQVRAEDLNFGIISTESTQNLKQDWLPLITDMEKKLGMKVNAYFAPDYAGIIEAMRFNKVQVAWYGNKAAMEAVDRASGEIFLQSVAADGSPGYYSHLIVHRDSTLNTLEDVLKRSKELNFGNGDPNSTSGFLVPSYYVFAVNKVDAKTAFKRVVSANHETNALAVVNKQVDVATNNSENLQIIKTKFPEKAKDLKVVWTSPLIPSDPIVWRKDLPDPMKAKLRAFFLDYGVKGDNVEAEKKVLAKLGWAPFKVSNDNQLLPIRQLELFRDRTKLVADEKVGEADKTKRLAEIDAKLDDLQKKLQAIKTN